MQSGSSTRALHGDLLFERAVGARQVGDLSALPVTGTREFLQCRQHFLHLAPHHLSAETAAPPERERGAAATTPRTTNGRTLELAFAFHSFSYGRSSFVLKRPQNDSLASVPIISLFIRRPSRVMNFQNICTCKEKALNISAKRRSSLTRDRLKQRQTYAGRQRLPVKTLLWFDDPYAPQNSKYPIRNCESWAKFAV